MEILDYSALRKPWYTTITICCCCS